MPKKEVTLLNLTGADLEKEIARIIKENPAPHRAWTQKEIAIVEALYGKVSNAVIAQQVNRGIEATSKKIHSLGLTRREK